MINNSTRNSPICTDRRNVTEPTAVDNLYISITRSIQTLAEISERLQQQKQSTKPYDQVEAVATQQWIEHQLRYLVDKMK